jgi:hypothetical protein
MSKLIVNQFKDVPPDHGSEVDRALDLREIDAEFARVARLLNGNLGPENLKPGLKFSVGTAAGAVPNAWAEGESIVTLTGSRLGAGLIVLGVAPAVCRPLCLTLVGANGNGGSLYAGASGTTLARIASIGTVGFSKDMTKATSETSKTLFRSQFSGLYGSWGGYGLTTSFSVASIPAGHVLLFEGGGGSEGVSVSLSLAVPHLG